MTGMVTASTIDLIIAGSLCRIGHQESEEQDGFSMEGGYRNRRKNKGVNTIGWNGGTSRHAGSSVPTRRNE